MRRVFQPISLTLALIFLVAGTGRAQGPVSIPLEFTSQGAILVNGILEDTLKARFFLDTGVGSYFISHQAFSKVSARPLGTHVSFDIDGTRRQRQMFELPSFSVGEALEINPAVAVWDMLDSSRVDGILSAMFFSHRVVTLDFREKLMVLEDSASLSDRLLHGMLVPVKTREDRGRSMDVFFDVMVGKNQVIECLFDTGASITLDGRFLHSLKVMDTHQWVGIDEKGGQTLAWSGRLEFIALAGAPTVGLDNPTVAFMPEMIYDGQIGWGFFTGRVVTFNLPEKYVIIQKH